MLSDEPLWVCLTEKFGVTIGIRAYGMLVMSSFIHSFVHHLDDTALAHITVTFLHTSPHLHSSASKRSRPRNRVARWHRPVQLELDPRIRSLVRAREADSRWIAAPAACDVDLRALHVQLCAGVAGCGVECDDFCTEEVSKSVSGSGDMNGQEWTGCAGDSIREVASEVGRESGQQRAIVNRVW